MYFLKYKAHRFKEQPMKKNVEYTFVLLYTCINAIKLLRGGCGQFWVKVKVEIQYRYKYSSLLGHSDPELTIPYSDRMCRQQHGEESNVLANFY